METLPISPAQTADSLISNEATRLANLAGLGQTGENLDPRQVAVQFEAIFWRLVLGRLREVFSEDGLFPGDLTGSYGAMFDMFLGDFLARSRSLGVAPLVERYLERTAKTGQEGDSQPQRLSVQV